MLFLTRFVQMTLSCSLTTSVTDRQRNLTTTRLETGWSVSGRVSSEGKMFPSKYHITYSTLTMEMIWTEWTNEDERLGSYIFVDELISTVIYRSVAQTPCDAAADSCRRSDALVLFCSIFRNRGQTDCCLGTQLMSPSCM